MARFSRRSVLLLALAAPAAAQVVPNPVADVGAVSAVFGVEGGVVEAAPFQNDPYSLPLVGPFEISPLQFGSVASQRIPVATLPRRMARSVASQQRLDATLPRVSARSVAFGRAVAAGRLLATLRGLAAPRAALGLPSRSGLEDLAVAESRRFDGGVASGRELAGSSVDLTFFPGLQRISPRISPISGRSFSASGRSGSLAGLNAAEGPSRRLSFKESWGFWAGRLTDAANLFFLPLSLPQIIKNWENISHGAAHLLAVLPWTGYTTGFLGNLFLMSVGMNGKNDGWARVQAVGAATGGFVLAQLYSVGFMPAAAFWPLAGLAAIFTGLSLADRRGLLNGRAKRTWDQLVPGAGWLATFLFIYMPLPFLYQMFHHPESVSGIAPLGFILGMLGNLVMLPEALRQKNLMWFLGSAWGAVVGGVVLLGGLSALGQVPAALFAVAALGSAVYLAFIARMTLRYFGLRSLREFSFRK